MNRAQIITFYSYKGGVGRTFLLVNTAVTLVRWGFRVLCLDWDLEAPGLRDYLRDLKSAGPRTGILDLLLSARTSQPLDWRTLVSTIDIAAPGAAPSSGVLDFIDAGDPHSTSYGKQLGELDWKQLYEDHDMSAMLERLRDEWANDYDFVFIDSRTGLTDTGGICSIKLPDILVAVLAPNRQGLEGALHAVANARVRHAALPRDRTKLLVLPIVSRWDSNGLADEQEKWLRTLGQDLRPLYASWNEPEVAPAELLRLLRVPYSPRWSFGEPIVVLQESEREPGSVTYHVHTIAAFLVRDLCEPARLVANREEYVREVERDGRGVLDPSAKLPATQKLFVSYSPADRKTAEQLVHELGRRGHDVWFDAAQLDLGDGWMRVIQERIERSTIMIALISDQQSRWQMYEMLGFSIEVHRSSERKMVIVRTGAAPTPFGFAEFPVVDARRSTGAQLVDQLEPLLMPPLSVGSSRPIAGLAERVAPAIEDHVVRPEPATVQVYAPPVTIRFTPSEQPREALPDYLAWVRKAHSNLIPYFEGASATLLSDVYVQLDLTEDPSSAHRLGADGLEVAERERRTLEGQSSLGALLMSPRDSEEAARRWLIVGEPGSGKTTLARSLAHELASGSAAVPVFVSLARWSESSLGLIDSAIRDALGASGDTRDQLSLREELERRARSGDLVFLLDGLDEVEPSKIDETCARIVSESVHSSRCPVAVFTRPVAIERRDIGKQFRRARIQPLSPQQQGDLLTRFLGAHDAHKLSMELQRRPALADLGRNPLMLTLIAVVARDTVLAEHPLPTNRSKLYSLAIDLLLRRGHCPEPRGVKDRVAARELLQPLSYRLHDGGGETWDFAELSRLVTDLRMESGRLNFQIKEFWPTNDACLEDIRHNSGVIGPHDDPSGPWRYLHRSLREFLAAESLAQLPPGELRKRMHAWQSETRTEERERKKQGKPDPERWGEVYALLCGIAHRPMDVLTALRNVSAPLARRALASVEVLEPQLGLEFLLSTDGWDYDDLQRLMNTWRIPMPQFTSLLIHAARPEFTNEQLGMILYAVECGPISYDPTAFFARVRPQLGPKPDIRWISIPAGTFTMGSPDSDDQAYDWEKPAHLAEVADFEFAATPITREQWLAFDGSSETKRKKPAKAESLNLPAVEVSWWEAYLFCRWIGARLPSETEWEYACRSETTTRYWSGDETKDLARVGWFNKNSNSQLQRVAIKPANPFGLFDMHGNAWEWCQDSWHDNYEGAPADGRAWLDEASPLRVIRGGSFALPAKYARSAYRFRGHPSLRSVDLGFRPARRRYN